MDKSLDRKLAAIHANPNTREFILADAKDADMAFGIGAPGLSPEAHSGELRYKTLEEYREQMRAITRQGLVDIMLMSASTNHALTIRERLFDGLGRHPRRPRQRHHRRPHRPRLALRRVARRGRSGRPASTTSSAATSTARPRSGPWVPTSACTA